MDKVKEIAKQDGDGDEGGGDRAAMQKKAASVLKAGKKALDKVMSKNSGQFLRNIKQQGGE